MKWSESSPASRQKLMVGYNKWAGFVQCCSTMIIKRAFLPCFPWLVAYKPLGWHLKILSSSTNKSIFKLGVHETTTRLLSANVRLTPDPTRQPRLQRRRGRRSIEGQITPATSANVNQPSVNDESVCFPEDCSECFNAVPIQPVSDEVAWQYHWSPLDTSRRVIIPHQHSVARFRHRVDSSTPFVPYQQTYFADAGEVRDGVPLSRVPALAGRRCGVSCSHQSTERLTKDVGEWNFGLRSPAKQKLHSAL